jgi:hypothetical protein
MYCLFFSLLTYEILFYKKVIVVVEVIGIIIILVKVLILMVIDGAVPEEEDFPIIEVVVFAVSYSSKKKLQYTIFYRSRRWCRW